MRLQMLGVLVACSMILLFADAMVASDKHDKRARESWCDAQACHAWSKVTTAKEALQVQPVPMEASKPIPAATSTCANGQCSTQAVQEVGLAGACSDGSCSRSSRRRR